jgi:hypothetical protein
MWKNVFIIANWFAIEKKPNDLTHMFCLWILFHKLYKEGVLYSHIKTNLPILGWVQKSLTWKTKHKIRKFIYMTIL